MFSKATFLRGVKSDKRITTISCELIHTHVRKHEISKFLCMVFFFLQKSKTIKKILSYRANYLSTKPIFKFKKKTPVHPTPFPPFNSLPDDKF